MPELIAFGLMAAIVYVVWLLLHSFYRAAVDRHWLQAGALLVVAGLVFGPWPVVAAGVALMVLSPPANPR